MNSELAFRISLAVIGSVYAAIRIYYTGAAISLDRNFSVPGVAREGQTLVTIGRFLPRLLQAWKKGASSQPR